MIGIHQWYYSVIAQEYTSAENQDYHLWRNVDQNVEQQLFSSPSPSPSLSPRLPVSQSLNLSISLPSQYQVLMMIVTMVQIIRSYTIQKMKQQNHTNICTHIVQVQGCIPSTVPIHKKLDTTIIILKIKKNNYDTIQRVGVWRKENKNQYFNLISQLNICVLCMCLYMYI